MCSIINCIRNYSKDINHTSLYLPKVLHTNCEISYSVGSFIEKSLYSSILTKIQIRFNYYLEMFESTTTKEIHRML